MRFTALRIAMQGSKEQRCYVSAMWLLCECGAVAVQWRGAVTWGR
jgi:hypothetical protein